MLALTNNTPSRSITRNCHCCSQASTWHRSNDVSVIASRERQRAKTMWLARVWLARGREAAPYNVFFFHESRERDGPSKFLGDYNGWVTVACQSTTTTRNAICIA